MTVREERPVPLRDLAVESCGVSDYDLHVRDELLERCTIDVVAFDRVVRDAGQGGDSRIDWRRRLLERLEGVDDGRDLVVGIAEVDGGDFQDLVARGVEARRFQVDD